MDHCTNVLIADGAEEFCTALSTGLQRAGGFVVCGTASDGEQAIRQILEKKPDILVLDLMLAKQDGISVLKAMITLPCSAARRAKLSPATPLPITRKSLVIIVGQSTSVHTAFYHIFARSSRTISRFFVKKRNNSGFHQHARRACSSP